MNSHRIFNFQFATACLAALISFTTHAQEFSMPADWCALPQDERDACLERRLLAPSSEQSWGNCPELDFMQACAPDQNFIQVNDRHEICQGTTLARLSETVEAIQNTRVSAEERSADRKTYVAFDGSSKGSTILIRKPLRPAKAFQVNFSDGKVSNVCAMLETQQPKPACECLRPCAAEDLKLTYGGGCAPQSTRLICQVDKQHVLGCVPTVPFWAFIMKAFPQPDCCPKI